MEKGGNRIQIDSKPRKSGKSLSIVHNKKIAGLNKDLLSKIDDILVECKMNNDLIPVFNTNNKPTYIIQNPAIKPEEENKTTKGKYRSPSASQGIEPKVVEGLEFDPNMPNINITYQNKGRKKLQPIKTKKGYRKKDGFLTGVGLIKQTKAKKKEDERINKLLAKNNDEINNMLKNIDEIDNFIKGGGKEIDNDSFDGSPDYRKKMEENRRDFEELIREIDGYKSEMKEEFDEIKYLIKFTDNTEKLIDRHKNVMANIFKGANIPVKQIEDNGPNFDEDMEKKVRPKRGKSQTRSRIKGYLDIVNEVDDMNKNNEDDEDFDDDEFLATSVSELNNVFYKMKKINQIKDNLCNIQDEALCYHEKFKAELKRSESAKLPIKPADEQI